MINYNFSEGASGVQQRYLYNDGNIAGPTGDTYDNIRVPSGWIVYWLEGAPGADPQSLTGRPEMLPIYRPTFPDAQRFLDGEDYSFKAFTFWRNNFMGIGQTVGAVPGREYSWSISAHTWYSECSTEPHKPPLEKDCEIHLTWANFWVRMGIDAGGGQSPFEEDIIWTKWTVTPYGVFPEMPIASPWVTATASYMTVWLQARTSHSLKHCDLYLSTADVTQKESPPSDCIYPAFPFHRTVNVYRPELGKAHTLEVIGDAWDKYGPQTFTPSYDEIPLGPSDPPRGLLSKTGRLWDIELERRWEFVDYYDENYPLKDYTILFEGEQPPPPPPCEGEVLSLHIQTEVEGVRLFVKAMADRGNHLGWIKLVKGFESSAWIHQMSPETKVLIREINHPVLWEDPASQARHIVDAVWDAVVRNRHVHALESTNEMFGTSNTVDELQYLASLEVAISNDIKARSDVLLAEQGREVIGVLINAPVGNLQHGAQTALLQPVVDVALRNGHGISYHPYFAATNNFDLVRKWLVEEGYHHHLRMHTSWMESLDGLQDCPLFCTEGGAIEVGVRSDNRPGGYLATNGWRAGGCLNGDLDFYIECLLLVRDMMLAIGGRTETYSIFTTGDPNIVGWDHFIVGKDEWPALLGALT